MTGFLALLTTMRLGLGAAPVEHAVVSLREEALAVAAIQVEHERERPVVFTRPSAPTVATVSSWQRPRHALTRESWRDLIESVLANNDTVASAAMWMLTQPVKVSMSGEKFFVSVRFQTP